jgi:phage tail-like protein
LAESRTSDPPFAGHFTLTVDGVEIGTFIEISGLSVSVQTDTLVEGGQNQYQHRLPKGLTWQNIVLKRGVTKSDSLFQWLQDCSGDGFSGNGNRLKPKPATISVLDQTGAPVRTWTIEGAFPVKWSGPKLAATAKDLAVEELEVCHHGFVSS